MKNEPCAKFTIRVTPKMIDSPQATRNSADALARPVRNCTTTKSMVRRLAITTPPDRGFLALGALSQRWVRGLLCGRRHAMRKGACAS